MAHLQYMPGDPRLVDQLVYELKSKGIFDQFRKECIADVDTRPAYQNLRQRVESSVSTFLSHQSWKPDMNKNQLREKLRKNILEGNYLEQGLERIVDQVVNPKVATVFKPQVEDLVYNFLGIARKKTTIPETLNNKLASDNLLPTDLEAVSPGSVKSDEEKEFEKPSESKDGTKMDVDEDTKSKPEDNVFNEVLKPEKMEGDTQLSGISDLTINDSDTSLDKSNIPLPAEEINPENIPSPENSPPKMVKVELEKIELPKEPNLSTDIPLPDEILKDEKELYFKPINSEDSSSDSSLRRNMSPLTPIRNFNNENSCDAQQAFENVSNDRSEVTKEPSSFRFTIEKSLVSSSDELKMEKKDSDQTTPSYQYNNQGNVNTFNTPLYDDSSNSNNLRIDYESDANSKTNVENKQTGVIASQSNQHGEENKKEQKNEEKKSSHKISHHSRDSHRHSSSSKDKRSDSKHSSSKDRKESKNDKKLSKDDPTRSKSSHSDKPKEKKDKKDSRDSSKHRSSSHNKSSSHKDSKSHRSSSTSSSHKHSSKHSDDKKTSSSSHKDRSDRSSDKTSKDKSSKDSKPTYRSDKDKKSSSNKNKQDEKEKKDKKDTDDHYSLSGRGNPNRRSTDRDSNDGSSSSKGSQNQPNSKSSENKNNKGTSSKSENTSTSNDSTSPSDNDHVVNETECETRKSFLPKPIVRIDSHLGTPVSNIPHLPFVPDVTLKKPKFAANLAEAKRLMKMRRFLAEEQRRMNQEAALLLEFQANVRPSLSQVYSSVPGPELEFICGSNLVHPTEKIQFIHENHSETETEAQVNHEAKEEMIIDDEIDIDLHKEIAPSHNHENSGEIMPQNNQTIHENNVYNEVSESSKHMILEESYTPTIELTRDRINEIIGVESFIGNNTIIKEEELYSVNKHELHNETATKIKTMTLEDPEIHNFNKEEFTKEKINEIIGVDAFENNFFVENNTVLESEPNSTESVLIYDSDSNSKKRFEVTIINEAVEDINDDNLVDSKESIHRGENNIHDEIIDVDDIDDNKESKESPENIIISDSEEDVGKRMGFFEVTIITEEISDEKEIEDECSETIIYAEEKPLEYFGEQEKFHAEIEKEKFLNFLNTFNVENGSSKKIYLFNCDAYEKNVLKEVSENFGRFEIVNYHKNGCLKLTKTEKNITKNIRFNTEITLPVDEDINNYESGKFNSPLLSPTKSEYSFDLPTDYNAKLDEMMKKASKRDIMEIILGIPEESPSKESRPDNSEYNLESEGCTLKRKLFEVEALDNNNKNVLTPNKIRKLSDSDQISSTTEETEGNLSNRSNNVRSKYLGKARRVGLPRPRRCTLPNSPSSDKSVENYEQNSIKTSPNGKLKATPRSKVQRYDTTDLYKPKLHYLSRRNNVT